MKCCDINAGKLRSKVTIQRKTNTPDGAGGWTEVWATAGQPFAMWKALSGSEKWQAMRVSPQNRVRLITRFKDDGNGAPFYSGADRVKYKGRTYSIESVIDIEDRKKWLEIMIVEGKQT